MNAIWSRLLGNAPPGTRMLDAGCGSVSDTKGSLRGGYSVNAFDGSAEMSKYSSAYSGQKCEVQRLQDVRLNREFYAVWSSAYSSYFC